MVAELGPTVSVFHPGGRIELQPVGVVGAGVPANWMADELTYHWPSRRLHRKV